MDQECVFCQIVAGHVDGFVIASNELCIAFLDALPLNPGHTLVVPRSHREDLHALDEQTSAAMFDLARQVAARMKSSALPCDGISLEMSNGEAADQSVFHAHLHVLPRFAGDGLTRQEPAIERPDLVELAAIARVLSG